MLSHVTSESKLHEYNRTDTQIMPVLTTPANISVNTDQGVKFEPMICEKLGRHIL